MRNFIKKMTIVMTAISCIVVLGAASKPKKTEISQKKDRSGDTSLIATRALIQDEFSGVESELIVKSFMNWMDTTKGDILITPPTQQDAMYFNLLMSDSSGEVKVFDMDLKADGSTPHPWSVVCRHTFYVIRVTSRHPIVKAMDSLRGGDEVLAFTFLGCSYKFIAVVADRMHNQNLMYTTLLHELGHMWGLPDNKDGKASIMNGTWPGSSCITQKDLQELYDLHDRGSAAPDSGCSP